MPRHLLVVALLTVLILPVAGQLRVVPPGEHQDAVALELMLRKLSSSGTFMQTDAHPDDEDNGLLAMLGHGRGIRTVLVTLTRGDGGQNEIGPELGQSLGVLRTEELRAVHRFDGAEQYFTRAIDFGYSFSVDESIAKWGHDEILDDLVRHIRIIRPDVIAGFLCGGQAGGLHHQASAKLTLEAFRAAADPAKYPAQLQEGLRPWQAFRYFCTDENSFAPKGAPKTPDQVVADISRFDPLLGRTYAEIGLEARSMHKCQGTSQLLLLPGQSQTRTYRLRDSVVDRDATVPADLVGGIDVSLPGLARFAGPNPPAELTADLRRIAAFVAEARQAAALDGPAAAVPALAAGRSAVLDLAARLRSGSGRINLSADAQFEIEFRLGQKGVQFDRALLAAAGVRLDALADDGVVTPGQPVEISVYAAGAGELRGVTLRGFDGPVKPCAGDLGKVVTCKATAAVPANTPFSTPYWTPRKDAARYDFEPDVPFGVPFRPTPFRAAFALVIGGEAITIERPVEYRYSDIVAGEKRSELNVSPPFNVTVDPEIAVFPLSGSSRKALAVTVSNNRKGATSGAVSLLAPAGWQVEPAHQPVTFAREDEAATVRFTVRPPPAPAPGESRIIARMTGTGGTGSSLGYDVVEYPHVRRRHVVRDATVRAKAMAVGVAPGLKVGYVMGVGDRVPEAIEQLGAEVTLVGSEMLASGDLSTFHSIVLGVRAYERRADLRANNQRLLDYAGRGGTVIVQYQKAEFNEAEYGPFPAKTSTNRVTDEHAPIEILVPAHPVFNTPNRIGPDAWQGWVQERGTYFLGERDARYVDLLRARDPFPYNAVARTGILVDARVGRGRWVYTGLGLWRQLPAGTDGAYRLLANLISLGKP